MTRATTISYSQNAYVHVDSLAAIDTIGKMFNTVAMGDRLVIIDAESLEDQLGDMDEESLDEQKRDVVVLLRNVLEYFRREDRAVADVQIYA